MSPDARRKSYQRLIREAIDEYKKAGLAAIYFTSDPGHFVTVSTAGAIHLFRTADRKQLGEFIPPQRPPISLAAGKNLSADEVRASVVLAAGGVIYQVSTAAPLSVAWKLDLGEEARQSRGIAAWRQAELAGVFPVELRRAFVPHRECDARDVVRFGQ